MKNFVELNSAELREINGGNTIGGGQGSGSVGIDNSTITGLINIIIGAINIGNIFININIGKII